MTWTDVVVIAVIAGILGLAVWYIYRSKKRGKKCIGCPDSCACDCTKCESRGCADQ